MKVISKEKPYERFFRVNLLKKLKVGEVGGTGLGLAIVKHSEST